MANEITISEDTLRGLLLEAFDEGWAGCLDTRECAVDHLIAVFHLRVAAEKKRKEEEKKRQAAEAEAEAARKIAEAKPKKSKTSYSNGWISLMKYCPYDDLY